MTMLYSQKDTRLRLIILRVIISILIIVTILGLWKVNLNAALIISGILLLFMILIVESEVQISDKSIIFYDRRLIKFLGSKKEFPFDNIDHNYYYPRKFNIFGIYSSYISAQNNAELFIFIKEGNLRKYKLSYHDKNYNDQIVKHLKKYVKTTKQ